MERSEEGSDWLGISLLNPKGTILSLPISEWFKTISARMIISKSGDAAADAL